MVLDLGGSRPVRRGRAGERGRPGSGLLYQQVVSYIEQLVSERGLAPGDMLPTHAELARLTGVSLITVRRALDELERAGKVRRHQGLGTFLSRPRIVTEPALVRCSGKLFRIGDRVVEGERIALPLASDGYLADGVLGASEFKHTPVPGAIELIYDRMEWFSV